MAKAKINVANVEGEVDYEDAMKEFGIEKIDKFLKKLSMHTQLDLIYRRGLVVGQRDFSRVYDAIVNKKEFAVLTGANPSGTLHLGNLLFLKQALFFQKQGADVYIPISNDETYVFKKTDDLEKATENAMENVIPDIIAMGLDPEKTHIFISTKTARVYEFAVQLSTKATFSMMKAIFGFTNETNPGAIFYGAVQSAHILFPELPEFGGPKPVVVPIGIDQDPYMRLSRDIADKVGMIKPSSTYHKFLPGLHGPDSKMSASIPNSAIFTTDSPEEARKKIQKSFSGGAASLREHREKGGNPDVDTACQYLYYMFEESDKKIEDIFASYRNGSLSTGDVKEMLADKVVDFLKNHQKKREKARNNMDRFMLKD